MFTDGSPILHLTGWQLQQFGIPYDKSQYSALNCTVHCTTLHCTALYCSALHCTAFSCTAMHCVALYFTRVHCTSLHRAAVQNKTVISRFIWLWKSLSNALFLPKTFIDFCIEICWFFNKLFCQKNSVLDEVWILTPQGQGAEAF